jgi:hypothetical protein
MGSGRSNWVVKLYNWLCSWKNVKSRHPTNHQLPMNVIWSTSTNSSPTSRSN